MNQSTSSSILGDISWIKAGQACWLEIIENKFSEETFLAGRIIQVQKQSQKAECKIKDQQNTIVVPFKHLFQRVDDEKRKNYDDMVNMECLNDPELLENLKLRFHQDITQTYVGPTLLVVNPYKEIKDSYSFDKIRQYFSHILEKSTHALAYKELPPHVFAVSAESFRQLFENEKNQAIVISGESGAGKTENTKLCMKFITSIGRLRQPTAQKILGDAPSPLGKSKNLENEQFSEGIEKKILSCNPILEGLGNCKTNRNYNSSRFGKYTTIIVEKESKKIVGAQVQNYLLEKSRIIQQALNERNFHIFYQFLYAASPETLQNYKLQKNQGPTYFEYLKKSKCYDIDPKLVDDHKEFNSVLTALNILGFKNSQQLIWKIISCVLKLGNLSFDDLNQSQNDSQPCTIRPTETLTEISQLLQIPIELLSKELIYKQFKQGQQIILKPLKQIECISKRDALSKFLFDKLFNWVVFKLNKTLITPEIQQNLNNESKYLKIGLLDIYGFEVFDKNYFEQFFINYTNERLQQLYIKYVFKEEELIFVAEDLGEYLKKLDFKDNQAIIDTLDNDKPPNLGIFNILDDCCQSASTDDGLLAKIKKTNEKNKIFVAPKFAGTQNFTIIHTAKDVEYTVTGFIEKNKDDIKTFESLIAQTSETQYITELLTCNSAENNHSQIIEQNPQSQKNFKSQKFSSARFRKEMNDLMGELIRCDVHFIRCIKPNEQKQQDQWNSKLCLTQIRYLGVLESIRVRKESYPIRREYRLFYKRYGLLMSQNDPYSYLVEHKADFRTLTQEIFKVHFPQLDEDQRLFGKTKIFLRLRTLDFLEEYYLKATYQMQWAAKRFQVNYYRYKKLKEFRVYRQNIIKIQRYYLTKSQRKKFLRMKQIVLKVQRVFRRQKFERNRVHIMKSVRLIQSHAKSSPFFNIHKKALRLIIQTQRQWRLALKRIKQRNLLKIRQIITNKIFHISWHKIEYDASIIINRNLKGHYVRLKEKDKVFKIKHAGKVIKYTKAALVIQKCARGYIIRNILRRMHRAAFYIQGYFKMRWLTNMLDRIKKAAVIIQRHARQYIYMQKEKNSQSCGFINDLEMEIQALKYSQSLTLFHDENSINKSLDITYEQIFGKKMYLFSYIIDFEILSDINEIYENESWADFYQKTFKENFEKASFLQQISVGEAHTCLFNLNNKGKYFGWNDFGQLGHDPAHSDQQYHNSIQFTNRIKSIQSDTYSWGQNTKGQLGLGHYDENVFFPTKISPPQNQTTFKVAKAKDDYNIAITEDGKVYHWPSQTKKSSFLTEIIFKKIQINYVSMGKNFQIFVTSTGLLYGQGENSQGQLGLGDLERREQPSLIEALRDAGERIQQVECGFGHCIAKSTLGKVYTWGWGKRGQLGHGSFYSEVYPRQIKWNCNKKGKILQIAASYQSSIVMTELRKIYWFGTNSQIKAQNVPQELHLSSINKRFGEGSIYDPLRIICSWSDTKSIIQITFANTKNSFEKQKQIKDKILNNLSSKWIEYGIDSIDPPYVQNLNNFVSEKHMKMPILKQNIQFESKVQYKNLINQIKQQEQDLQDESYQNLNTSIPEWLTPNREEIDSTFDADSYKKYNENEDYLGPLRPLVNSSEKPNQKNQSQHQSVQQNSQMEKTDLEVLDDKLSKIAQCRAHESLLLSTPYHKWTQADLEFMESIKNMDFDKMEENIIQQKQQIQLSHENSQLSEQTMNQLNFIKTRLKNLKNIPREQWTENDIEMVAKARQISHLKLF